MPYSWLRYSKVWLYNLLNFCELESNEKLREYLGKRKTIAGAYKRNKTSF